MKKISLIIAVIMILACLATLTAADAEITITSTVNISTARQNMRGHGYSWDNIHSVLTLKDVDLKTGDDFGFKLPANCTVVLEGNNKIKAGKYGISCSGDIIFKGNGSLTIEAGEIGIYFISQDKTTKARILDGSYSITAGEYGIYSEYTDFSVVNGKVDINMTGEDAKAVCGRVVNFVGGNVSANAPLEGVHSLTVDSVNIDVSTSGAPALDSGKLNVKNEKYDDGSEEYTGASVIKATGLKRWHQKSIILGDAVPGYVDYIMLAGVLLLAFACIFVPVMNRKKKKKALYEKLVKDGYMTKEEADEKLGIKKR